jgi:neutral ceramidase
MYTIGVGKKEITGNFEGIGMLGYGKDGNDVLGSETALYSRAFVFEYDQQVFVLVNAELCFFTLPLRRAILQRLQQKYPDTFCENNVMLTAQHTHSAPGGIADRVFYNTSIPGFKQEVFEAYTEAVLASIESAWLIKQNGRIFYQEEAFDAGIKVAFNRSLKAFNANKEIQHKFSNRDKNLAVDRSMKLMHFEDESGEMLGAINWFGVHATSVSNDNTKICSDNKGYAAFISEQYVYKKTNKQFVHAFAQEAAGDVSPNYVWDKQKKWMRGPYENDFESARHNGQLQADKAHQILAQKNKKSLKTQIDSHTLYFDWGNITADPKYTGGKKRATTSPACIGMSFFSGTQEGPGVPRWLLQVIRPILEFGKLFEKTLYRASLPKLEKKALDQKFEAQSPKALAMELGKGRIFWVSKMSRVFFVPDFVDPLVKMFRRLGREGVLDKDPWGPTILPLQLSIIGTVAIAGIPAEITTMAGRRLRQSLLEALAQKGIEKIILSPYANAYAGYITTEEEYQLQYYEGGHTLFGKWTLAALQTKFDQLAQQLLLPKNERIESSALHSPYYVEKSTIWRGFEA